MGPINIRSNIRFKAVEALQQAHPPRTVREELIPPNPLGFFFWNEKP